KRVAFPHHYDVALEWDGQAGANITAEPRPQIVGGAPSQFGGRDDWWSPEHLLLSAVSLCLMTTFQAFARKHALSVARYGSLVRGILDKTPEGLGFTSIVLEVDLSVAEADVARAREL